VHVRVLSPVGLVVAPVAGRRGRVEPVLGFEEAVVQDAEGALQFRVRVGEPNLDRAGGREDGERVAVAVARVVLGFAPREEPVVAFVPLVPLDVPEEVEPVLATPIEKLWIARQVATRCFDRPS
jgi:hypothetical protein